jgi:hypothetical protein
VADSFDAVVANAGAGGSSFAMDSFSDASAATRVMPFTCLVMPDGSGYARAGGSSAPLYVRPGASTTFVGGAVYHELFANLNDGDTSHFRCSLNGALLVSQQGTVTVSGTVTANAGSGTMAVSAASLPLPSGASTAANQATANTALAAIQTAVEIIDNAVAGNELQVDVITLPSVTIDSSALPTGAATLAEQQSQTTQLSRIAGKYVDFDSGAGTDSAVAIGLLLPASGGAVIGGTSSNPLRVDVTGSTTQPVSGTFWQATQPVSAASLPLPTGASTLAEQQTQTGHLATLAGTVTGGIAAVGGTVTANAGTNLNTSALAVETGGNLAAAATSLNVVDDWDESDRCKVNLVSGQAGITAGAGAVGASTPRVTLASDDPAVTALQTLDNAVSGSGFNVSQLNGVNVTMGNGAAGTGVQRVTLASDSTGTLAGVTTVTTLTGSGIAHDAGDSGNPHKIGARARSTDITAVSSDDRTDVIATLLGKLVAVPYAIPGSTWSYAAASGGITNTTGVTAKAAAGAGIRNYVTRCQVINGHATVDTDIQICDGASGTVLWRGFAKAAGGGVSAVFDPPLRGTANTLVEVKCGTTGSATYFNLQGFTAAE